MPRSYSGSASATRPRPPQGGLASMAALDGWRFDIRQTVPGVSAFASNQCSIGGRAICCVLCGTSSASSDAVPRDRNLTVAVLDADCFHALEFPCRCNENGCWIDVRTGRLLDIRPTHWREHPTDSAVFKRGLVRCCSKKTPSTLRVSYLNQIPHVRRQKPSSYVA